MKILGIGAHPDDIEFGCGGTFYKLVRSGHTLNMLVMSRGDAGGSPGIRQKEQEKSARFLNARLYWGDFKDTDIALSRDLIQAVENKIKLIKPDIIFACYHDDTHQDHRNVSDAVVTAARYLRNLIFYEVPTTLNFVPDLFVDIGGLINKKVHMLKCHSSQVYKTRVQNLSIIESAKSAAIFRGYQDRVKYAEAFVPQRLSLDFILKLK
ncbi:MAG: PIG-L family deacetylase [Elusimicrobia bacterium]|nr:PIG-L family deacetylase [Elusimicrobiota bacterium]